MKRFVTRSTVEGTVTAPSSKSMMQRAVAIASLGHGKCRIDGITGCADLFASIRAAGVLGSDIEIIGSSLIVNPRSNPPGDTIDCGEAGLTVRMFAPIAALYDYSFVFTGSGSLLKRPINMIEEALSQIGVQCTTENGFLPMRITGPAQGGQLNIDGSVSSQLLTGLLIALAHCTEPSELIVSNLTSRPYIDMTIAILQDFGIQVENRDYHSFYIAGGAQSNLSNYYVEGDWSGAAFLIVAAALAGTAEIKNLSSSSSQGDMAIIDIVRSCGVDIKQHDNSVTIDHSILKPFTCDATECPDLFPPLVALASACPGESRISGVHRLAYKESNRGDVLVEEFVKIGVPVRKEGNDLVITGGKVRGGVAHSCNDHRIAMALAVAGLVSEIGVTIEEAQVVDKSYPGFFEDLHNLGVEVQ